VDVDVEVGVVLLLLLLIMVYLQHILLQYLREVIQLSYLRI
jgi:hypothetical protein